MAGDWGSGRSTYDFFDAPVESALVVEVGTTPPLARVAPFAWVLELTPPGRKSGGTTRVVPETGSVETTELAVVTLDDVDELDVGLVELRKANCEK